MSSQKSSSSGVKEAARILGSRGGQKGGPARSASLSPARKRAIASKGGKARGR